MMMEEEIKDLYPIKFAPIFKERIWGGDKIKNLLGYDVEGKCGEVWTVSCVDDEVSVVSEGFLEDNDLEELVEVYMGEMVGDGVYQEFGVYFPILVKFIDSEDWLSVQVHPDDEYARKEGYINGKTEMWYVVDAEPGAQIINGFKKDITKMEFVERLRDKKLVEVLNFVDVQKGDVIMIPAGRVHALGKGIVVAEIQQTSDITYRIHDWDRVDSNGMGRKLHLADALNVVNFARNDEDRVDYVVKENGVALLVDDANFAVRLLDATAVVKRDYGALDSYVVYTCVGGSGTVICNNMSATIHLGESILIPAAIEEVMIVPMGHIRLLEASNE